MNLTHSSLTVGGCLAGYFLVSNRIATQAELRKPPLSQQSGLRDRPFPIQAQSRFAALASIGSVLKHEHLAICWGNLAHGDGNKGIAQLNGLRLGLRRLDSGLGELDLSHNESSESPNSRSPMGVKQMESGSSFRKHRYMMSRRRRLINLLYLSEA